MSVELTFDLTCSKCDKDLIVYTGATQELNIELIVEPCPTCLAAAELEGFDRAQQIVKENNAED